LKRPSIGCTVRSATIVLARPTDTRCRGPVPSLRCCCADTRGMPKPTRWRPFCAASWGSELLARGRPTQPQSRSPCSFGLRTRRQCWRVSRRAGGVGRPLWRDASCSLRGWVTAQLRSLSSGGTLRLPAMKTRTSRGARVRHPRCVPACQPCRLVMVARSSRRRTQPQRPARRLRRRLHGRWRQMFPPMRQQCVQPIYCRRA